VSYTRLAKENYIKPNTSTYKPGQGEPNNQTAYLSYLRLGLSWPGYFGLSRLTGATNQTHPISSGRKHNANFLFAILIQSNIRPYFYYNYKEEVKMMDMSKTVHLRGRSFTWE
jgi:hypothetical protein